MNLFRISASLALMVFACHCQNNPCHGFDDLAEPLRKRIMEYTGPNRVNPSTVSKSMGKLFFDQYGDMLGDSTQLIETRATASEALNEGYDRLFLLRLAVRHDKVDIIKFLITPPDTPRDSWSRAEINWLKGYYPRICDDAQGFPALKVLVDAKFICEEKALLAAVERSDVESVTLLLPIVASDETTLVGTAISGFDLTILRRLNGKYRISLDGSWMKKICYKAARLGKIDALERFHRHISKCHGEMYDGAIKGEHMDVLEWAKTKKIRFKGGKGWAKHAAFHGRLEVLIWGKSIGLEVDENVCIGAAKGGCVEILRWAKEEGLQCSDPDIIFWAKVNGHDNVLEWALASRIPVELSDRNCVGLMTSGSLEALQWYFDRGVVCNQWYLNYAFENNRLNVLEWASDRGIQFAPDFEHLHKAVKSGNLKTLQWASNGHGLVFDNEFLLDATKEGCFDVSKWAYETASGSHNVNVNSLLAAAMKSSTCLTKQETDDKAFIQWAVSNGATNLEVVLEKAVVGKKRSAAAIKWLLDHATSVTEATAASLAAQGRLQMLKLAASKSKGAVLSGNVCTSAIDMKRFSVLHWLVLQTNGRKCLDMAKRKSDIVGTWAELIGKELKQV